ncbi:Ig-like domain-containing protein [Viridibacillus arvi]|uniref:Ig-like domain-containing protein n=1 Tax=Viridibacillus arvi TaxID=263475 RepID=UPI0036ECBC4C
MKYFTKVILLSFLGLLCIFAFSLNNEAKAAEKVTNLNFTPFDTDLDKDHDILYMTDLGSKTIYAYHYKTGQIKSLKLPYAAERLTLRNGILYVTQMKQSHTNSTSSPNTGAIAAIKTNDFTIEYILDVETDPYDIAVDKDNYLYITPGSGQHNNMLVYNLATKQRVENTKNASMYEQSTVVYSEELSKLYTISKGITPTDIYAKEINHGIITASYDSPYHGDYVIDQTANLTPDGLRLYNLGTAYSLTSVKSGDMTYRLGFDERYDDFAFNDQLTFAASRSSGIDVYAYDTNDFQYTLYGTKRVKKVFVDDGLIAIMEDGKAKYSILYNENLQSNPITITKSTYESKNSNNSTIIENLQDGSKYLPLDSTFKMYFNQKISEINPDKFTLKDASGEVPHTVTVNKNVVTIQPNELKYFTDYKLSITDGAVAGYQGATQDTTTNYLFTTKALPASGLTLSVNDDAAPAKYIFTASASQGSNIEYQFSVATSGNYTVVQPFSSSRNFAWQPTRSDSYTIKVDARSKNSGNLSDTYSLKSITVVDHELPKITTTTTSYDKNLNTVTIFIQAIDNIGIRSITLPNDKVVNSDKATFTVSKNGSYFVEVEDLFGNVRTEEIFVDNIDNAPPTLTVKPNTTKPTNKNITLTINATDNVGIKKLTLPDGSILKSSNAKFIATKNGIYKVIAEDYAGFKKTYKYTVSNIYKQVPKTPVVHTLGDADVMISGTAEAYVDFVLKIPGKKAMVTWTSDDGTFKFYIPRQKAGAKVTFYAKNPLGQTSKMKTIIVKDTTPPPVSNISITSASMINVKSESSATVYIYNGKKLVKKTTAKKSGYARVQVPRQKVGTTLSIYAKDKVGNKSKVKKFTIK